MPCFFLFVFFVVVVFFVLLNHKVSYIFIMRSHQQNNSLNVKNIYYSGHVR